MSETQTADPPEPEAPDPADPVTTASAIREDLARSEQRYQQALSRERAALTQTAAVTERLQTVEQDRQQLEYSTVANALDGAQTLATSLQSQYATAMEAGDFKKAGEISLELGKVGQRIATLEDGKAQMEANRAAALRQPQQQPVPQQIQQAGDPIETDLAKRDARAAAWLRSHADADGKPKFYTDEGFRRRVTAGHELALADRLTLNSPEYFAAVEKVVGVNQQNNDRQQPARRDVPSAAPTRQTGAYRDGGQRANGGAVPADVVKHCVGVMGFTKRDGSPDMLAINDYWKNVGEMDRAGQFKNGNPWVGAR